MCAWWIEAKGFQYRLLAAKVIIVKAHQTEICVQHTQISIHTNTCTRLDQIVYLRRYDLARNRLKCFLSLHLTTAKKARNNRKRKKSYAYKDTELNGNEQNDINAYSQHTKHSHHSTADKNGNQIQAMLLAATI